MSSEMELVQVTRKATLKGGQEIEASTYGPGDGFSVIVHVWTPMRDSDESTFKCLGKCLASFSGSEFAEVARLINEVKDEAREMVAAVC